MMPDQLEQYRRAVDDEQVGHRGRRAGLRPAPGRHRRRRPRHPEDGPKGYPKDHPRIELLRHKGLIAWKQWPVAAWMGTAKAKQRVVDFLSPPRPSTPGYDTNVGPSATPPH